MTARTTTEDPRVSHAREALRTWDGGDWLDWKLLRPVAGELAAAIRSLLAVVDDMTASSEQRYYLEVSMWECVNCGRTCQANPATTVEEVWCGNCGGELMPVPDDPDEAQEAWDRFAAAPGMTDE